jgi:hypothetical protein
VSKRIYPYIGGVRRAQGGTCDICRTEPVVAKVDVQTNWFRGDDEVFRVGERCKSLTAEELMASRGRL